MSTPIKCIKSWEENTGAVENNFKGYSDEMLPGEDIPINWHQTFHTDSKGHTTTTLTWELIDNV